MFSQLSQRARILWISIPSALVLICLVMMFFLNHEPPAFNPSARENREVCGGAGGPVFRRGDHDGSGIVDITDSLNRLNFLFFGTFPSLCQDASDFDNSGIVDLTDSINELTHLFLGTVTPPPPGTMECGPDPTEVIPAGGGLPEQAVLSLGCDQYPDPNNPAAVACP